MNDNTITRYVSHYKPIAEDSGKAKEVKARVKEIMDKVELMAQDTVTLDQTPEDQESGIGHAAVNFSNTGQNGMVHKVEKEIKFTPSEDGGKPEVTYLLNIDTEKTAEGELIRGISYGKLNYQTFLGGSAAGSVLQDKVHYDLTECNPETGKYLKEELEVSVKGPGIKYTIKDMNDPSFREEMYFLGKDDLPK